MKKTLSIFSLVLALSFSAFGQATAAGLLLTATSLSTAIKTTNTNVLTVASATGITAGNTILYLEDGVGGNPEAVFVNAVNGTQISVTRGYEGTQANPHLIGTVVLAGPPAAFVAVDPSGACTSANSWTPTINIFGGSNGQKGGAQWICSSVTQSWVPGYFNDVKNPAVTAAVASVAGATNPSGQLFHVTGTNAITAWGSSTSAGLGAGGGSATQSYGSNFCIIPDAIFTWTATNNIAVAGTVVVNKVVCWVFDGTNKKYVPSSLN
jgi:hypothetical protein